MLGLLKKQLKVPYRKCLKELKEEVSELSTWIAPNCFPNYKNVQAIARNETYGTIARK
jgi:hypothetical protein